MCKRLLAIQNNVNSRSRNCITLTTRIGRSCIACILFGAEAASQSQSRAAVTNGHAAAAAPRKLLATPVFLCAVVVKTFVHQRHLARQPNIDPGHGRRCRPRRQGAGAPLSATALVTGVSQHGKHDAGSMYHGNLWWLQTKKSRRCSKQDHTYG